jgi:large subunit ribosomal protein L15
VAAKKGISVITLDVLIENGLVSKNKLVKILGRGELTAKLNVSANAFSKTAVAAIEAKGGSVTVIA